MLLKARGYDNYETMYCVLGVNISAVRAPFCMKFYTTVKQQNVHFTRKFCWNMSESDTIILFQQDKPYFSAFRALSSPIVCWWLWKELVCRQWDQYAYVEMDTVTADAQRDHYWRPQPCTQSSAWWCSQLPCWCVLVAALPRWSAGRLSTHQSSEASAGVYSTFSAWHRR